MDRNEILAALDRFLAIAVPAGFSNACDQRAIRRLVPWFFRVKILYSAGLKNLVGTSLLSDAYHCTLQERTRQCSYDSYFQ